MKLFPKVDPAFRLALTLLAATSIALLLWQCSREPANPSRIGWPALLSAKP